MPTAELWERVRKVRVSAFAAWVLLAIAVIASIAVRPNFLSAYSLSSTFAGFLPLVLLAIGQAIVVIGGGLDLSVGAVAGLASVTSLTVMASQDNRIVLGLLVAVTTGAAAGLVNGLIVSGLRLQPLITTFATASIFAGMTLWVLPQPGGRVPSGITQTFRTAVAGVPVTVLLVLGAAVLWLILARTTLVRHIYAVGGNPAAAYASLVPVARTQTMTYVLAGSFAGLAGVALLANSGSGDPFVAGTLMLDSIAAVVIGGIALRGGLGSPLGAIAGAIVLLLLTALLFFAGVPPMYRTLAQGLIVIAALALSAMGKQRRAQRT